LPGLYAFFHKLILREEIPRLLQAIVTDVKAGGHFVVQLDSGQQISAKLSGRMRKFHIRVILGDRVTVGVSPYDPSHGLIIHREKLAPRTPFKRPKKT
jgi:translation initiation factor IF-1